MGAMLANALRKDELQRLQEFQYAVDQYALTVLISAQDIIINANEKFLQISGYSQDEVFRRPFSSLLSDEFRIFFGDNIMPILSRGLSWKGELCHTAKNGHSFWTEGSIVPIIDANRGIRHYHFIASEVTERKAVEKTLTNNIIFFTRLMELAPIGFFLADAEGRCTYINSIWTDMSGCRLRKALGNGWIQAVYPDDRNAVQKAWLSFIREDQPFNCEYRYLQSTGKIVWVLASAERVDFAPDARTRYIRVEKDLTEHKETEQLIHEQRAQMAAASKMSALGEMAGGIAHEINNPLAILQLQARQIVQLVRANTVHEGRLIQAAENIRHTTDRIASIIRSLRAIARDGHGDPLLPTPVKALIEHTLELCAARFKSHRIELIVRPFPESLEMWCRSVEIMQALLNLVNNAYSAIGNLEEKWVEVSVHDRGNEVEIWITDSGHGIPVELQDKLFQPFFTTKPIGSGTGLGLSTAKAVALDHRGDLWLASDCPHTRFVLKLPKKPPETL